MSPLLSPRAVERAARRQVAVVGKAAGGGRLGERATGGAGRGTTFLEHRRYAPGDDLRYVDWNAWGRLRQVHVKVHEMEETLDLHLLVDRTASMGRGPGSKLEAACRTAALVGTAALAAGDTVRLQFLPSIAGDEKAPTRSLAGRASVAVLLGMLQGAEGGVREPLGQALRDAFPRLRRRGCALLLTDFLDDPGGDARRGWRHAVDFLAFRRVALTAVHVIAPEERDPPFRGALRLQDAESGADLDLVVDDRAVAAYRTRFDRHLREVRAYLRSKEARHLLVETTRAGEDPLLRQLLAAEVLR